MKRSRFNEEQIIAILKEQESGLATADLCRKHGISIADLGPKADRGNEILWRLLSPIDTRTSDRPLAAPLKALAWRIVGQGASITRRAGARPISDVWRTGMPAQERTGGS